MLLPYATDNLPPQRPIMTFALLIVNSFLTLGLLIGVWTGRWQAMTVLSRFGIVPARFNPFTLISYMFFHESLGHLMLNMFYLWVFGAGVEIAVGRSRFLLLYLLSGMVGGGLQWLVIINLLPAAYANVPIVGASAACAGMIGLYAVRYYRAHISFSLLWFSPHVVTIVSVFLFYEIGSGLWSLAQGSAEAGVAHWAHIGGFVFGLSCAHLLRLAEAGQRAYLTEDATRAMERSVPGAAIRRWETLLSHEPGNIEARSALARAWMLLGDDEQATTYYRQAVCAHLDAGARAAAAQLYVEMHEHELMLIGLSAAPLYALGNALEEAERFVLAAETLREIPLRSPEAPEAETALVKVISLYVHRLHRPEEARQLLLLFRERYPTSAWSSLAEDLQKHCE